MDYDKIRRELEKKLDPDHVKKPDGKYGPKGDYIEGWHAVAEANAIFGFNAWSYTITSLSKDALEQVDKEDRNGKTIKQWQAAYTCVVRVEALGVVREDVGFGSGFAAQIGDAIEGATKEAVTDALKRCLRTFGNRFGLALYDKSRANVGKEEATEALPEGISKLLPDFIAQCFDQHGGGEGFSTYVADTFAAGWKRCTTPKQMGNALTKHKPSLDWLEVNSREEYGRAVDAYETHMMELTGNFERAAE